MRVSYNWLRSYVEIPLSPQELAKALTARGVTVETVSSLNPGASGVVVGRVVEINRHPNADTLWVCQVDIGDRTLQIITGAQNVRQGDLVPAAIPGATIPGKTMAVASLRGLESNGMLCSPDELGIDEGHDGILIIPPDTDIQPGMDALDVLGLNDWILELDLTANYASHAQSMVGVAQEVAGILGLPVEWPETYTEDEPNTDAGKMIRIAIDEPALCARYVGRIVRGVKVGPSPAWMQAKLRAAGMRPISNIVDISNFVMLELGQPLHTFDYAKVRGRQIIVRRAGAGERFTTLDNQERVLDPDVLVIADGEGPVALAGVMGGLESEVTDATTEILIESAHFDNINNRRTALRYNLPSEAARRFTKGVDPSGQLRAANRAAQLIAELAGGKVVQGHVDTYVRASAPPVIILRTAKVNAHLGLSLTAERMAEHLTRLGMAVLTPDDLAADLAVGAPEPEEEIGDDLAGRPVWQAMHQVSPVPLGGEAYELWATAAWANLDAAGERLSETGDAEALVVVVPTRRLDVATEIDLVEEVARAEGYDAIPVVLPVLATARGGRTPTGEATLTARRLLAGLGLDEVMAHSLVHPRIYDKLNLPEGCPYKCYITLGNPMYEERSTLRTTLLAGLLDTIGYNANRQIRDLGIFELAHVYQPVEGQQLPEEPLMLGIAITGSQLAAGWNAQPLEADFYVLKGYVEALLDHLNITEWSLIRTEHPSLHPGRRAGLLVGGERMGFFGELHPKAAENWDLAGRVYVAEFNFGKLLAAAKPQRAYSYVPRFPAVTRDVAMIVSEATPAADLAAAIRTAGGDLVEDVLLFDLYQGEHVQAGHRSLAYRVTYRAADRTLADADIEKVHGSVRKALAGAGAELRS